MNGLPYYKAYPRDFLDGTVGLSFEVKCAYRVLIDLIYLQSGSLPDDGRYIAGHLGCSVRKWTTIRSALLEAGKIAVKDGIISNFRADKEIESLGKFQDKQRENRSNPNKNKELQSPKANHTDTDTDKREVSANAATSGAQPQRGSGDLLSEVMAAVGLTNGRCPSHWMPPAATIHVKRWQTDLGLTEAQIIEAARESRKRHDEPPNGPKALDSTMKRLAGALKADPLRPASSPTPQQSDTASKRDRWRKLAGDAA